MSTCRFCGKRINSAFFFEGVPSLWLEDKPEPEIFDALCKNSTKMWGVYKVHQPKEEIVQQLLKEIDEI